MTFQQNSITLGPSWSGSLGTFPSTFLFSHKFFSFTTSNNVKLLHREKYDSQSLLILTYLFAFTFFIFPVSFEFSYFSLYRYFIVLSVSREEWIRLFRREGEGESLSNEVDSPKNILSEFDTTILSNNSM